MYILPKRWSTNKHLSAVAIFCIECRKLLWNSIKTTVSIETVVLIEEYILTLYFRPHFLNDLNTDWIQDCDG